MIIFAELKIASMSVRLVANEGGEPRIQIEPYDSGTRTLTPSRARILGETLLRFADATESEDP